MPTKNSNGRDLVCCSSSESRLDYSSMADQIAGTNEFSISFGSSHYIIEGSTGPPHV
jgi:hypothetical protein